MKYYKNLVVLSFLFFFVFNSAQLYSQNIDSLYRIINTTNDNKKKAKAFINISNVIFKKDPVKASFFLDSVVTVVKKMPVADQESLLPLIYFAKGNLFFYMGLYQQSLTCFYEVLRLKEKVNDTIYIASMHASIANVFLAQKMYDDALKYYISGLKLWESLSESEKIKQKDFSISVYNNLGNVYFEQKNRNMEKTKEYYFKGLNMAQKSNDYYNLGLISNNIGNYYIEIQKFDSAYYFYNKSLENRLLLGSKNEIASSYRSFGVYYYKIKDYAKATEYLEKAHNLANELKSLETLHEALKYLALIYAETQNYEKAYKLHLEQISVSDSLQNKELTREITKLEMGFLFEKQTNQFLLDKKKQEFRFILISVSIFFIALLMTLLYFLSRNRIKRIKLKEANLELQTKNLELEKNQLKQDLELRNRELTANAMYMVKKNELLNFISKRLMDLKTEIPDKNQTSLQKIIFEINSNLDHEIWKEFEMRFSQVHEDFYTKLKTKYPDLTPNEIKLCAYLRLNLNTKEIATLLQKNENSVMVARFRLRKKFNLTNTETDLLDFLSAI